MKTLRKLTFSIEILGIVVIALCASILLQYIKKLVIDDEIKNQKSNLAEINYYLDTSLNANMTEFLRMCKIMEEGELHIDMDGFSDLYYVDDDLKLLNILKKEEDSLIFEGYDISTSRLGDFVRSMNTDTPKMSPMMKSSELDSLSVYISLKEDGRYLVGRIGLEKIEEYLKVSAQGQDAIIVVISDDGYVIGSTEEELPLYVVPEFKTEGNYIYEDYFLFKQKNESLGNNLVIMIHEKNVLELLDNVNDLLPVFLAAVIIVMILKIVLQDRLIIKPLKRLSHDIEEWDFESKLEFDYPNVLDTYEIKVISNQFAKKSVEIKEYVKELNDMNKHLEITVEDKTRELTDAVGRLVESEKLASLSNLVAGVAHEVNTPIGVCVTSNSFMMGELEKIRFKFENNRLSKKDLVDFIINVSRSTEIIESNLKRSGDLIKSFKQVAADQASNRTSLFGLRENIEMVVESLRHEYKRFNVKFNIDCPKDLYITASPGEFSQIFTNFIMNSASHAFKDKEGNEIRIKCASEGGNLIIDYEDNGVGIPKENIRKIFEPFFTTNSQSGNTGLGMNIVYNLVSRMSGKISCESDSGEGVCFHIVIPYGMDVRQEGESNSEEN